MKLLQRLRNLYKLSGLDVTYSEDEKVLNIEYHPKEVKSIKPKMAVIIKKTTPSEEFLKENPNE